MSHEQEKSGLPFRKRLVFVGGQYRPTKMSSDMKSANFFCWLTCRTTFSIVKLSRLTDWLTAGTIATTPKQRDSHNHSGRN